MYHDYYDIIHRNYDYELDLEILDNFCQSHNTGFLNLLEIGCGTGRHTALLSKRFEKIFAIDIDSQMIKRAQQYIDKLGIKNVFFFHASALELQKVNINFCDVSCSFFNVVNYMLDFSALINFFSNIGEFLNSSGICIFDCLDTSKKYKEKASFLFTYDTEEKKAFRSIESTYDTVNQMLYVDERYSGLLDKNDDFHKQTYKLWNIEQIELALKCAGFSLMFYDRKTNINSKYQKPNQVLFLIKKR